MNLYYRPLAQQNTPLDVNHSVVVSDLKALFGDFPIVIRDKDRDELLVLRKLYSYRHGTEVNNPYQRLLKLLNDYPDGFRITTDKT